MAFLGSNITISVEAALQTAITSVTTITKADPGVVTTGSAHGYTTGDVVVFDATGGMVELDGQAARIVTSATNAFSIEGLDTTNYSAHVTGTISIQKVTSWNTLSNAQSVSMPNPSPQKIDITTLVDKSKQYAFGLPDAPDGTINGLFDPTNTAVLDIYDATKANDTRVFKIAWAGGQYTYFNANVSGGQGFDLQANAAATSTISFTPVKDVMNYAS